MILYNLLGLSSRLVSLSPLTDSPKIIVNTGIEVIASEGKEDIAESAV